MPSNDLLSTRLDSEIVESDPQTAAALLRVDTVSWSGGIVVFESFGVVDGWELMTDGGYYITEGGPKEPSYHSSEIRNGFSLLPSYICSESECHYDQLHFQIASCSSIRVKGHCDYNGALSITMFIIT